MCSLELQSEYDLSSESFAPQKSLLGQRLFTPSRKVACFEIYVSINQSTSLLPCVK